MPTFISSDEKINPVRHELPYGDPERWEAEEELSDLIQKDDRVIVVNANSGLMRKRDPENPESPTNFAGFTIYLVASSVRNDIHFRNISVAVALSLGMPYREDLRTEIGAHELPAHFLYVPDGTSIDTLMRALAIVAWPRGSARTDTETFALRQSFFNSYVAL